MIREVRPIEVEPYRRPRARLDTSHRVGAVESKAAPRESGPPAVSNVSERGGAAVASASLAALLCHPVSTEEKS